MNVLAFQSVAPQFFLLQGNEWQPDSNAELDGVQVEVYPPTAVLLAKQNTGEKGRNRECKIVCMILKRKLLFIWY